MAILVTGGAGYIGSHTVVELLNEDYEVVIVDDFSNAHPAVLDRIEELTGKTFAFYELNLLDKEALKGVFEDNDIEAVVHFAGFKAVGESVAEPLKYYHNNITGTLVLLEVMQEFDVKKIVFSSSATVYGMNNEAPFTEDMPTSATNPYGKTKVFIEHILSDLVVADPDWSAVLLRYFNPIGAHESGRIGEDYSVLDVVHAFENANKVDIPYEIVERRPGDIAVGYADPTKAKTLLGWEAKFSLEDMCRTSWIWQKNNPGGYA